MYLLQTTNAATPNTWPHFDPGMWSAISIVLWLLVGVAAFAAFGPDLRRLLDALQKRIQRGGAIKAFGFDLPELRIRPEGPPAGSEITAYEEVKREWSTRRENLYGDHHNVFIAHRLTPSMERGQLYDVLIYLIPHVDRGGSLKEISHVEYFLGSSWGCQVFVSRDSGKRFAVAISAFGRGFLCTARIHLRNGSKPIETWRYIDFEMGELGEGGAEMQG